jgi:hypothetical protein
MPSGSCVLKYQGKRGTVWRIKFKDASGRQVKETVGKASEGWTKRKAEAVLRARLTDVAREGYVKPEAVSFETFARGWLDTYPDTREHRRTTRADYRAMVENHLIPAFGSMRLADVRTADVDAYVAAKRRGTPPLGPRTLGGHLTRLHSIFDAARRQGLVQANPVSDAERPRVPRSRWTILSPVEIAAAMRALDERIEEADTDAARAWRETAKAMTMAMQYAWLRRGELLGLAWRDIELSHPDGLRLHVRETWVRGYNGDPKTDEGTRTIGIDGPLAEEVVAASSPLPLRRGRRAGFLPPDEGDSDLGRLLRRDHESGADPCRCRGADARVPRLASRTRSPLGCRRWRSCGWPVTPTSRRPSGTSTWRASCSATRCGVWPTGTAPDRQAVPKRGTKLPRTSRKPAWKAGSRRLPTRSRRSSRSSAQSQ